MKRTRIRTRPCSAAVAAAVAVAALWSCAAAAPSPAGQSAAAPSPAGGDDNRQPPVRLRASLSTDRVQVAEPFALTVRADAREGVSLQWPPVPETLGPLNVRDVDEINDIPLPGGGRQSIRIYRMDSYESGALQIPPIRVAYADPYRSGSDATGTAETDPLTVAVTSVLEGQGNPAQLRDIQDVVDLPSQPAPPWRLLAAGAAAAALAIAVALAVRRYRGRPASPAQTALDALERLAQQADDAAGSGEALVAQVTTVLRHYIEQRFQIAAPRLTTREFLQHARQTQVFDRAQQQRLADFLQLADLVKFAGLRPDSVQAASSIAQARQFVLQTRQQPAQRQALQQRPGRRPHKALPARTPRRPGKEGR